MGMFDYVQVTCPHCDNVIEDQTKQFNCIMDVINLDEELPSYVASAFIGEWTCDHCNERFNLGSDIPEMVTLEKTKI